MNINQDNINDFLNKYIDFTNNLSSKNNYPNNIKHVLYLIIPAFVMKYGIREERNILSCFENVPIYISDKTNKLYTAYFNRRLYSKMEDGLIKYYSSKEVVINNYYDTTLIDLIDSLAHEFNHAVNSIANEIKWNDEEVSLRTGLSYIHFFRSDINKVKSISQEVRNKILQYLRRTGSGNPLRTDIVLYGKGHARQRPRKLSGLYFFLYRSRPLKGLFPFQRDIAVIQLLRFLYPGKNRLQRLHCGEPALLYSLSQTCGRICQTIHRVLLHLIKGSGHRKHIVLLLRRVL